MGRVKIRLCFAIPVVAIFAASVQVAADFSENFDSYAAGAGLPAPWVNSHLISPTSLDMNVSPSPSGFAGTQGTDGPGGASWYEQQRPTGHNPLESVFQVSWKARLTAHVNSIARLSAAIGNGSGLFTFEMQGYTDGTASVLGFFSGHAAGAIPLPVLRNRWYKFTLTMTRDGAGNWTWTGEAAEEFAGSFGPGQSVGAGTLPASFSPSIVQLSSVLAFEEGPLSSDMSAIDDVEFTSTPSETINVVPVAINDGFSSSDVAVLSFDSTVENAYRVQHVTNLNAANSWITETFAVGGTGSPIFLMDPDVNAPHKFYRVISDAVIETPTDNMALSYSPVLEPNYWGFQQPLHGDNGQLIDGITVDTWNTPGGEIYSLPSSMGWASRRAVVTLDLGWIRPISGFGFHTVFSPWGPWWPHQITMLVSDDGLVYRVGGPAVTVDPQQLVPPLTPQEVQTAIDRNPLGTPSTHWFEYHGYQTRGQFVTLVMEPHPDMGIIVMDELEIYEGPVNGLFAEPAGTELTEGEGGYASYLLFESIRGRMTQDVAALRQEILSSSLNSGQQQPLVAAIDGIEAQIPLMVVPSTNGFQATLPVGELHEDLFEVQADFWQALHLAGGGGSTESDLLHVWQNHRWDPLPLIGALGSETANVEAVMARNAIRSDVLNLSYAGDTPAVVEFEIGGLPVNSIEFFLVPWTDTTELEPVAAALLPIAVTADTFFDVDVTPGLTQQIWIRFNSSGMAAGTINGSLTLRINGGIVAVAPITMTVLPPLLPDDLSLSIGGWDYPLPGVMQVTDDNLDGYVAILKEYGVNTTWMSGSMPVGTHDIDGTLLVPPSRSEIDHWVQHWPTSRWHAVTAGALLSQSDAAIAAWAVDWENYLQQQGIPSEDVMLLIIDEPNSESKLDDILRVGQAVKAASSFKIFNNIHYADPTAAPAVISQVMAHATDVQCFNVGHYLQNPAANSSFIATHSRPGLEWWCYTGAQADRRSDPYVAWLLRSWFSFETGMQGTHWWAFGDGNGGFSWNEYFNNGASRTPLFLDADSVAAGKSMEAMREGVQDYEILTLLAAARAVEPPGPTRDAMDQILSVDIPAILTSHTLANYPWVNAKDRSRADDVRITAIQLLP